MPQTTLDSLYLHVFNTRSGLWESTMLGLPVSPLSVEAMNLILRKDGIAACIDSRAEYGLCDQLLRNETDKDFPYFWTLCPGHTLHAILGLRRSIGKSGRLEIVFYGSPLTVALMVCLAYRNLARDLTASEFVSEVEGHLPPLLNTGGVNPMFVVQKGWMNGADYFLDERFISRIELHEAVRYLDSSLT